MRTYLPSPAKARRPPSPTEIHAAARVSRTHSNVRRAKINEQLTAFEAEEGQRSPRDAAFAKVSLGNIHGDQLEKAYAIYTNVVVTVATAGVFAEGAGVLAPEIKTGVTPYQVGRWNTMNSARDGLDLHHVGQAHAMEQLVPGYSRTTGPAIALPRAEHALIPNLRGPVSLTPRQLLARDIVNLRLHTNAPGSNLRELIRLNKQLYPRAFKR